MAVLGHKASEMLAGRYCELERAATEVVVGFGQDVPVLAERLPDFRLYCGFAEHPDVPLELEASRRLGRFAFSNYARDEVEVLNTRGACLLVGFHSLAPVGESKGPFLVRGSVLVTDLADADILFSDTAFDGNFQRVLSPGLFDKQGVPVLEVHNGSFGFRFSHWVKLLLSDSGIMQGAISSAGALAASLYNRIADAKHRYLADLGAIQGPIGGFAGALVLLVPSAVLHGVERGFLSFGAEERYGAA